MKICPGICILTTASLLGSGFFLAGAGQNSGKVEKGSQPPAGRTPADKAPAKPTEMEMMQQMMAMATPGEEHEWMKAFEGTFKGVMSMEMEGKPMISNGIMKNTWVLGGRFMRQEWKSDFMGQPFEGLGYMGFDRAQKKYFGTWMDTMSTACMVSEGSYDQKTKTYTMTGQTMTPEGMGTMRQVVVVKSNDEHFFEAFMSGPDGKEMPAFKIAYTRDKSADKPAPKPAEKK
jgi:hypothetical protein